VLLGLCMMLAHRWPILALAGVVHTVDRNVGASPSDHRLSAQLPHPSHR